MVGPKGPRYSGQVAVLIGAQNSSATFQFAGMMARERLTPQPDAGVIPDIAVPLTATAIADGSDPAMARALA